MEIKSYFLGVITAALLLLVITGGFFLGKQSKQNQIKTLQEINSNINQTTNSNNIQDDNPDQNLSKEFVELQITQSLEENDFDELTNIISDTVDFFVESENCCGELSPKEGLTELKRLSTSNRRWKIVDISDIDSAVKQRREKYLEDAIILISEDNFLGSFVLDEVGYIKKIYFNKDFQPKNNN